MKRKKNYDNYLLYHPEGVWSRKADELKKEAEKHIRLGNRKTDIDEPDETIEEYRKAKEIGEKMVREYPQSDPQYQEIVENIYKRMERLSERMHKKYSASRWGEIAPFMKEIRKAREQTSLENRAVVALIGAGLLASLFFFSFNFTGNVISSNFGAKDGNILGIIFFLVGLIGAFFYSRRKNNKRIK